MALEMATWADANRAFARRFAAWASPRRVHFPWPSPLPRSSDSATRARSPSHPAPPSSFSSVSPSRSVLRTAAPRACLPTPNIYAMLISIYPTDTLPRLSASVCS